MSYIEQFLGKKAQELTYHDIQNFFAREQDENDKMEFKSYHGNERENDMYNNLLECVCGFLNSSGGLLIWGAPDDKTKKINVGGKSVNIKSCIGDLKPIDFLLTKETFINKVTSTITPSPNSVKFLKFEHEKKYVYLIEVEKSEYSPHQFAGKYPMRLDASTIAAPHHYVEALFKKISFPKLKAKIEVHNVLNYYGDFLALLQVEISNLSKIQNEQSLNYRIEITGNSKEIKASRPNMIVEEYVKDKWQIFGTCKGTLYYGQPFKSDISILIDGGFLESGNLFVKVLFGGRHAPLQVANYKFFFDKNESIVNIKTIEEIESITTFE